MIKINTVPSNVSYDNSYLSIISKDGYSEGELSDFFRARRITQATAPTIGNPINNIIIIPQIGFEAKKSLKPSGILIPNIMNQITLYICNQNTLPDSRA